MERMTTEIEEQIFIAYENHMRRHLKAPTVLYLGTEEYIAWRNRITCMRQLDYRESIFYGMDVYEVVSNGHGVKVY